MKARIDMLGIITSQLEEMTHFYESILGFEILTKVEGNYVEFTNDGVRFALSTHKVMKEATGIQEFETSKHGHCLELAFRVDSAKEVDSTYKELTDKGAKSVKEPADMPWGQRTAFFADPDGNVHEIFTDF